MDNLIESLSHRYLKFEDIFLHHSAVMLIINPETGKIIDANNAAVQFYNYTIEEFLELTIFDISLLSKEEIFKRMEKAKNKEDNRLVCKHKLKNGEIRIVEVYPSLITVGDNNFLLTIINDITESFQKDEIIKKEREKFKIIADYSYGWEYWLDENFNIVYMSKGCEEITGYSSEEFIKNKNLLFEIVHTDFKSMYKKHVEKTHLKKSKDNEFIEFKIITKDKKTKWIYHVCRPVYSEDGKFLGRRVSNRDITNRKLLLETVEKERDLFNEGPVVNIIWKYEEGWPVSYVSNNIKDILGYDKSELLADDFKYANIIHPEDLKRIKNEVTYYISNNINTYQQEYRLKHKDGHYLWIYDFTKIVRDEAGSVEEIRGYFFDQTHIRELQDTLNKEKEKLSHIIEAANIGTWQWNLKTGEIEVNERWAEIIGYSLKEISPVTIKTREKFCHSEDLKKSNKLINDHFVGKSEFYECEMRMKHKDGHFVWVLDKGKVISYDENGKPHILYGICIEIDKIKKLESKLKTYLDYLNRAQKVAKVGSWYLNIKDNKLWWSKQTYKMFGIEENKPVSFELFLNRVHPDDKEYVLNSWQKSLNGEKYDIDHRIIVGNDIKYVNNKAEVYFDEDGNPIEAVGTVLDITEKKYLYQKIEEESNIIKKLFNLLPGYLWFIKKDRTILRQNKLAEDFGSRVGEKCWKSIFGCKFLPEKERKMFFEEGTEPENIKCEFCLADEALEKKESINVELEDNGKCYKTWWIPVSENEYMHYCVDITHLKEIENTLREMSVTDPLTKVFNRRYFAEKLEREIELARRTNRTFSLIMFDIDHFKKVNDTYGHDIGDKVLKSVVNAVKNRIRKVDILARWGGEEFLILLPETKLLNSSYLAEELRNIISELDIDKVGNVTASFGVTEYKKGDTVDTITKRVDDLMYKAKNSGRNCVCYG
ncbi:diguanylate cyclase [Deferribacter autotrophicus]|uniref:histidine kinase n=1 Tax=Deferribacter autotrophicus TaxID=500465 RepID=A0A5A8F880_9BACT|nr:sensor domain-containing diguanylate cyclase [Deferribacter autotrophicus]KAA0258248.1 diguanylate cyclase [Deferribacter autotrophicus]